MVILPSKTKQFAKVVPQLLGEGFFYILYKSLFKASLTLLFFLL